MHQEAPPAPASLTSSPSTGTSSPVWLSPDAWEERWPPAQPCRVPVPPPAASPRCAPLAIAGPSPARGHRSPTGSSPTQLPRQPDAPTEAAGRPGRVTQEPNVGGKASTTPPRAVVDKTSEQQSLGLTPNPASTHITFRFCKAEWPPSLISRMREINIK